MTAARLRTALLAPLLLIASLAFIGLTAQTADAAPICTAKVTKLYKSGGNIIGVMTMTCSRVQQEMRILTVFARSGGGHANKTTYNCYVYCYDKSTCVATVGVVDVSGSNRYWFTNDPQGTRVSQYLQGSNADCTNGIACSGKIGYF